MLLDLSLTSENLVLCFAAFKKMALLVLPPELLTIIISLSDAETLKALRLTSHLSCALASKELFSTVSLFTDEKSCENFQSIINDAQLKNYVHKVRLNTVECDYVRLTQQYAPLYRVIWSIYR